MSQIAEWNMSSSTDRRSRFDLLARRVTAWLLEVAVINLTLAPPVLAAYFHLRPEVLESLKRGESGNLFLVQMVIWTPYLLVRDILGPTSFGKRLLGLAVAKAGEAAEPASRLARVIRNIPLVIPLVPLAELVMAIFGNPMMQRMGDRLAETRVVDAAQGRNLALKPLPLLLLGAALFLTVNRWLMPILIGQYLRLFLL